MNQANHSYTDSVENNSTFQTDYCFANDSVAVKVSRVAAYCLVLLVSVIGNSLLIFTVMSRTKRSQRTLNYFILNMTIADLLITFGYMPRAITLAYAGYEWQVGGTAGLVFCKLTVLFHETAVAVSNFTVAAISLDRFFAVVFPLKTFMTKRICATICVVVWLVAVSLRLPMVYSIETVIMFGTLTCFLDLDDALGPGAETAYYYITLIVLFSIPLLIITVLYASIFAFIWRRKPPEGQLPPGSRRAHRNHRRKMQVLKVASIVVVVYILCWMLYFIALILHSYKITVSCDFQFVKLFLAHLNSALNPCIVFWFNVNFRKALIRMFSRFTRRHSRIWSLRGGGRARTKPPVL